MVWNRFEDFMRRHGLLDPDGMNTYSFVTCGDWDLKTMLPQQLRQVNAGHGLDEHGEVTAPYNQWINLKIPFITHVLGIEIPRKIKVGIRGMLKQLELELIGRHHSGIDDTRNILREIEKMRETEWDPSTAPVSGLVRAS